MNDISDVLYLMAAMVLFSMLVMNSNRVFVRNAAMLTESEIEYSAISVAQSMIDEARTKAFDEITVGGTSVLGEYPGFGMGSVPGVFTAPGSLGPEAGEVYPNFNDFDDYNGLSIVRTTGYGDFEITAIVTYVNPANPTEVSVERTITKRLTVVVRHPALSNSVSLSYIKTFY